MIGIGCFAAKTKKYNRKTSLKDKTGSKKAVFILFTDHDKKWMGKKKQEKKVTDANYIPRTEEFRKTT